MEILRTPEHRFEHLPGFDWEPLYVDVEAEGGSLRMAYVEDGPADGARRAAAARRAQLVVPVPAR